MTVMQTFTLFSGTCAEISVPGLIQRKKDRITADLIYDKTHTIVAFVEQELSYRQQIARQLRTQYTEGMYRLKYYTVTLKSRLRVTQGHWKRNHWIDHTRLSSSRVI